MIKRPILRELLLASMVFSFLYAGAYYLMLSPIQATPIVGWYCGAKWSRNALYRWHSPLVVGAFRPMHRLDRRIRPSFWFEGGEVMTEDSYPYPTK